MSIVTAQSHPPEGDSKSDLGTNKRALRPSSVEQIRKTGSDVSGSLQAPQEANRTVDPVRQARRMNPLITGGLAGAVTAGAIVLISMTLATPVEPRLSSLGAQIISLEERVGVQEISLQEVGPNLANAINIQKEAQERRLDEVIVRLDLAENKLRSQILPGSPVFEMAVQQLATAIRAGRPFPTEWINLYAMVKDAPDLKAHLQELMPAAHIGIDTLEQLQTQLQEDRERIFFQGGAVRKAWIETLYPLQQKLGFPMILSPAEQVALDKLDEAAVQLRIREIDRAITTIAEIQMPYVAKLESWRILASRYQAAMLVITELTGISQTEISNRLRQSVVIGSQSG